MKKLFTILLAISFATGAFTQAPEKMSYQAVIRDAGGELIKNQGIGMQVSILQGSESGTAVYVGRQNTTTNANGLTSIMIGAGAVQSGDFVTIDWADGLYFVKIETDPTEAGGTNYTIEAISQLLSVPYALNAKTADNGITTAQADAIVANTLKVCVTNGTAASDMQYWNGSAWVVVATTANEGAALQMIGGVPTWTGGPPPPPPLTVTSATGKTWMDRNLGATQVATSSTDSAAYGDLYQWGRDTDGHEKRNSSTTSTLSSSDTPGHGNFITNVSSPYNWRSSQNDNLWQGVSGTNNPCPAGFRLPTAAEWEAERQSWSSNDAAGAFASPLKLPLAGYRNFSNGSLYNVGSYGYYWSGTLDGSGSQRLSFGSSDAYMVSYRRAVGLSVRCLKE